MSLCKGCISGVRFEGEPAGKIQQVAGVETYVSLPASDVEVKDTAILFLTDVFGLGIENNKLLADDYAKNGYVTYLPDLFNKDPVGPNDMNSGYFDFMGWLAKHGPDVTRKAIDPVYAELSQKYKKVAALGFCFGGKYAVNLAQEDKVQAIATFHPSLLQFPDDVVKLQGSKAALLFVTNDPDPMVNAEGRATLDKLLSGHKPHYEQVFYQDTNHGFMVRGDYANKPEVKKNREQAFAKSIEFLQKQL